MRVRAPGACFPAVFRVLRLFTSRNNHPPPRERIASPRAPTPVFRPAAGIMVWLVSTLLIFGWGKPVLIHADDPDPGYGAFRLLQTRNIFDPDRRAARTQTAPRETAAPARIDSLTLTGTMVQPDRALAFFSGSRPEYRQVVSPPAEVAGHILVAITTTHVELERNGERVRVPVGQGLRRQGDGPWELSSDVVRTTSEPRPTASTASAPAAEAEGGLGDMLKRMMERRQREVSR